jgi:putative ABC transport system permease protein
LRSADGPLVTVVGVAADHKVTTVDEPPTPFFHVARSQSPNSYNIIMVRTHGDAERLLRDMRRELLALEPTLLFLENQTMAAEVATTTFPLRARAWLVAVAGLVATTLAVVGLYGVIAYSVARRRREIGIRLALGARPASVVGLIMGQGLAVALLGLGVGCVVAAVALKAITGQLYGVSLTDPVSWGGAAGLLLCASALANLVPARRAARVNPSVALRSQ